MNTKLKKLYFNLPVGLQNVAISIYGCILYLQRYGKAYRKHLEYFKNKDYTNLEKELCNQVEELKRLIIHAKENSKFYNEFYRGLDVESINSVDDIKLLPILDKEVLRSNIDDVYTVGENHSIASFTGGTTGKSLKVRFTKLDMQIRMAYLDAFKAKLGVNPFSSKKATFSGREFKDDSSGGKSRIFWRHNWIYRQKLYSTFDLTDENLPFYVDDLNKFKPDVLNGFVSALYVLAKFIDDKRLVIKFRPKAIFTTSETLLPVHRELLERVFGASVYNQYASAEGAPFITQCKSGSLHYNIDTGVIEEHQTPYGNEVLVTSFTSYGTPLVRYKIGDSVKFKDGVCSCGSSHPLVESIEGRKVDFLYSPSRGNISSSHMSDVIKGMPNCVKGVQFVQNEPDRIIINISVDDSIYTNDMEQEIIESMTFRFGLDVEFEIRKLGEMPREASGKMSLIKNNIPALSV